MAPRSTFNQAVADVICERMAAGESLSQICRDENLPSKSTVCDWAEANPAFAEQYARARERLLAHHADELLEIADDGRNDWMERRGEEDAGWVANGEHIQRSRLRVDTRKWMLSKLLPKVYGDVVRNEHSGPDGGALVVNATIRFVEHVPPKD